MGSVTDYIADRDEPVRTVFESIRLRALASIPDLAEGVSYGMPTLMYRGNGLLSLQETAKHLSLFPHSGNTVSALGDELDGFDASKGTIRFSAGHPIPPELIDRIVQIRRAEIDAQLG